MPIESRVLTTGAACRYLQTRKRITEAEEKLLFPKEVSEGKRELNHEEAQYKYGSNAPSSAPLFPLAASEADDASSSSSSSSSTFIAQTRTRWVRPATDPFQQWHYVKRTFDKARE